MKPHESIYAGTFMFTLGYLGRESGLKLPPPIELPLAGDDPIDLAGIVRSWRGRTFIVEFAPDERRVRDCFRAPGRRELLELLQSADGGWLRRLSRRGHFIGYWMSDRRVAGLVLARYFEIADSDLQQGSHLGMAAFFEGVITNRIAGLTPEEFTTYVAEVASHTDREPANRDRLDTPTSLVINFDAAPGAMRFVMLDLHRDTRAASWKHS
jgi:hypothetical protein